ncbi:DUF916 and DUF3324 domain-containing protein [Loigolactobacillus coryniformis]|uniref:DUF916 and DUF3324 domain-containing protein n=1 Tax=Loigolactobacillus coryniformis TaxID=1610 RepID=A0A5B8THW3_9LACO|nr:DUF916 and DUF3324 domain-containing protein [Loigolactobacillus coryniformis]QEA53820.1 DUF916 and DUF3324 domain-containing protein [Loigolactobacillus coryniformis]
MKKRNLVVTVLALGLGLLTLTRPVAANELTFGVETNLPDNQLTKNVNYFDLKLDPGQQQTISVTITNSTNKEVKLKPEVNAATTNLNGVVEYTKTKTKADASRRYSLADYVRPEQRTVTVPAQQKKQLNLKVTMPRSQMNGVIAGGLRLQDQNATKQTAESSKGTTVQNQYAYIIGIVLHQNTKTVTPQMKLGKVAASQVNYRNVINTTLRNVTATYINQLTVKAKIYRQGSQKISYRQTNKGMQMAPNSQFAFPVRLNGQPLKAGKYTLDLVATSKDHKWHFKHNFTIAGQQATKLNKRDVTIKPDYTWLYTLIGAVVLILLIGVLWFFNRRKLKAKEAENAALRAALDKKKH